MMDYGEYKKMYAAFYNITDEETLRLAHLIDSRLEEAKGVVGSANKGVGYWVAEKLIGEGYRDTKGLAAVLKEATDEAIKRMNEDLDRRFIPINEYLSQRDKEVQKETAKEIYKDVLDLQELMVNNDDALCILRNVESWAKDDGVKVEI